MKTLFRSAPIRVLALCFAIGACAASRLALAESAIPSQPVLPAALSAPSPFVFTVYPATAGVGQVRRLFLTTGTTNCESYTFTLDSSALATQNLLVLRTQRTFLVCPLAVQGSLRRDFEFTINRPGPVTVRWDQGGSDVVIQTLAAMPASRFDVNGMWFDPATNGSGLSIHHRRSSSDAAFGTWFLFGKDGTARWYTLQSANWQQDGSVLEGLLIEVTGNCTNPDLTVCPAIGTVPSIAPPPGLNVFQIIPAVVRITFESSTRARAEVSSISGQRLFTSELRKLGF